MSRLTVNIFIYNILLCMCMISSQIPMYGEGFGVKTRSNAPPFPTHDYSLHVSGVVEYNFHR